MTDCGGARRNRLGAQWEAICMRRPMLPSAASRLVTEGCDGNAKAWPLFSYAAGPTNANRAPLELLGPVLMAFFGRGTDQKRGLGRLSHGAERTSSGPEPSALVKLSCRLKDCLNGSSDGNINIYQSLGPGGAMLSTAGCCSPVDLPGFLSRRLHWGLVHRSAAADEGEAQTELDDGRRTQQLRAVWARASTCLI